MEMSGPVFYNLAHEEQPMRQNKNNKNVKLQFKEVVPTYLRTSS